MTDQIACFTFFRYKGTNKKWGFGQMFKARPDLDKIENLKFYKLVGLGGGTGYSLKTNFESFGIFTVWDDPTHADRFFKSTLFGEFLQNIGPCLGIAFGSRVSDTEGNNGFDVTGKFGGIGLEPLGFDVDIREIFKLV